MTGPLKDDVDKRLPWLATEFGFRITNHAFDFKYMGASFVELHSETMHLRFTRDRGPIYLELASPREPQRWFECGFLWMALTGDRPEPSLDGWARFLGEHFDAFAQALGPPLKETTALYERKKKAKSYSRAVFRDAPWSPGSWVCDESPSLEGF